MMNLKKNNVLINLELQSEIDREMTWCLIYKHKHKQYEDTILQV